MRIADLWNLDCRLWLSDLLQLLSEFFVQSYNVGRQPFDSLTYLRVIKARCHWQWAFLKQSV